MDGHDEHLTLEMILAFRRGEISKEELLLFLLGHVSHRCPPCREELRTHTAAMSLLRGYWLSPIVWRTLTARLKELRGEIETQVERQLAHLRKLATWAERAERISKARHWYKTEATALAMLDEARRCLPGDGAASGEWADLALEVARRADQVGRPFATARALALAYRANAERVVGNLASARALFAECRRLAREQLAGEPYAQAEMLSMEASMLRDLSEYREAAKLLEKSLEIYRLLEEPALLAKNLVQVANVHVEAENYGAVVAAGRAALQILEHEQDPKLTLCAVQTLAVGLTELGEVTAARQLLETYGSLYERFRSDPWIEGRRLWLVARLAVKDGEGQAAAAALRRARSLFVQLGSPYDWARVGLEESLALFQVGYRAPARALAERSASALQRLEAYNHKVNPFLE